jgi:hypothetical protein
MAKYNDKMPSRKSKIIHLFSLLSKTFDGFIFNRIFESGAV